MANISVADQLDDAIEMMIAEPGSAPPRVDLKIGELLGIAAELRLLPDPAFRVALKVELLGASSSQTTAIAGVERKPARSDREAVLPTLFGAGSQHHPSSREGFGVSVALHAALLLGIAASGLWLVNGSELTPQVHTIFIADTVSMPRTADGRDSGGGTREKQPETKGSLPRVAREQLTPPTIVVPREQPKLAEDMTLVGPPELSQPQTSQVSNPLASILGRPSNGSGSAGGIGTGHGGGVGGGEGAYRVGGGVSAPRPIYDPDPEYSDEARQAKYQGTVMLWVVVGADGRAREIRVQQSLGMGLDEKAIQAVRGWKFAPGMKDGVPVAVQVNIEVVFRLL